MKKTTVSVLIFLILNIISSSVLAEVYKWVDENGKTHYGDKPKNKKHVIPKKALDNHFNIKQKKKVSQKTINRKINTKIKRKKLIGIHGENSDNQIMKLRKLLKQEKYYQLTESLQYLSQIDEKNLRHELTSIRAFNAFYDDSDENKKLLDRWIIKMPQNAFAYLARASYYYHLAWKYRGKRYVQKTKKTKLNAMHKQFGNSEKDIAKALKLQPNLLFGYYLQISIASVDGETQLADLALERGLKYHPLSFFLRERLLYFKVPKWGGSLPELSILAEQYQSNAFRNKNLSVLKSLPIRAVADILYANKQYEKAETFYEKTIKNGKYHLNFFNRGKNFYKLKNYKKALENFDESIALNPYDADIYYYRSFVLTKLKQHEQAYRDIRSAILLEPYEEKYEERLKYLKKHLPIPGVQISSKDTTQKELDKINAQIELKPKNAVLYFYRAKVFLKRMKNVRALNDLRKAIKLKPDRFEFHLLHDQILIKENRYDEIIASWTQYLKLEPNDSKAYLERAGTYYHKLDIENATKDAKRAMDLGNSNAEKFYKKLIKL